MRITIDLDGATLEQAGVTTRGSAATEDIDAGGPPAGLIEALAMEGALGPVATLEDASEARAPAGPHAPVRETWDPDSTLMKRRRE